MPRGERVDVRMHTRHFLRPERAAVEALLASPAPAAFRSFRVAYQKLLAERFARDRASFDDLAERARHGPVYLGCNCPTKKQPDVSRCHTVLALEFMKKKYPRLKVELPR